MTTGERIKQLRKQLKLSADELGAMIGKNRSTIYRYESRDISSAPIDIIPPLAKALKTTPQHLLGWDKMPTINWIKLDHSEALWDRTNQWFTWTGGYIWTDEEIEVFAAQAKYLMRIKGKPTYKQDMRFLSDFYSRLK